MSGNWMVWCVLGVSELLVKEISLHWGDLGLE